MKKSAGAVRTVPVPPAPKPAPRKPAPFPKIGSVPAGAPR